MRHEADERTVWGESMLRSVGEVEEWVRRHLIRPYPCDRCGHSHDYFRPDEFGPRTDLPSLKPEGDVAAFGRLVAAARRAAAGGPGWWFYVTDPDNMMSALEWVRPCDWDRPDEGVLGEFERNPAAEGGASRLVLAGPAREWLLVLEPADGEVRAAVYGPTWFGALVAGEGGPTTQASGG